MVLRDRPGLAPWFSESNMLAERFRPHSLYTLSEGRRARIPCEVFPIAALGGFFFEQCGLRHGERLAECHVQTFGGRAAFRQVDGRWSPHAFTVAYRKGFGAR